MSKLTDFEALSFDVYGTLIDWERGLVTALQPALVTSKRPNLDLKYVFEVKSKVERDLQVANPRMKYSELLTATYKGLCKDLGLREPTDEEAAAFGASIKGWPAFPDTVDALRRLQKHYKLVVLSNIDNESFAANNASSMEGFEWDAVLTAETIGSYKPDKNNFEYMLREVKDRFGIEKSKVIQTAQSQFHDHQPARDMGIKGSWIVRPGGIEEVPKDQIWNWKFDTLGEMADAFEKELAEGR